MPVSAHIAIAVPAARGEAAALVSTAADVWALGVVICEALVAPQACGPSGDCRQHRAASRIFASPFREMISKCLSRKPEDRPDIARLQAWQKGGDLESTPAPRQEAVDTNVAPNAASRPLRLAW